MKCVTEDQNFRSIQLVRHLQEIVDRSTGKTRSDTEEARNHSHQNVYLRVICQSHNISLVT